MLLSRRPSDNLVQVPGMNGPNISEAGAPVGPRNGSSGRSVVNPKFPIFFNQSRHFAGYREKWPAVCGGGNR